jgi:replicative DNA helicase
MRKDYEYENFDIENFYMENLNNNSKLILIASRPGVGKTSFAFNLIVEALKNNKKILINSLEMNGVEIFKKLDTDKNNYYLLNQNDAEIILSEIEKVINKNSDVSLIVIDYLQLLDFSDIDIETFVKNLKLIALKHNISILILSQLDREVEKRENKIPQQEDIRELKNLSDYIDLYVFLYKENNKIKVKQIY